MEKDYSKNKSNISSIYKLSISDFLDSVELPFSEQIGQVRYYTGGVTERLNIKPFAVNIKRNQWINQENGQTGQLASLLDSIIPNSMKALKDEKFIIRYMRDFYLKQIQSPGYYPITPIRNGKLNTMLVNRNAAYGRMAKLGLSMVTLSNYCSEMLIIDRTTGKEEVQIAFPCDNHEYYLFNGSTLRPLDDPSITTFGTKRKGQNCYVYENALDFLAMSEIQHRNRADYFHKKDYHLIINGRQNLKQACQFIHDNPDFQDIFSFMPINNEGKEIYKELNMACEGTLIDGSKLFDGFGSLIDRIQLHVPSWFIKEYEKSQREEIHQKENIKHMLEEKKASRWKAEDVGRKTSYGPPQTIKLEGTKDKNKVSKMKIRK